MLDLCLYGHRGDRFTLAPMGKGGGEGNIYRVNGLRDTCAKIYRPEKITNDLHNKILAMVNHPPDDPTWLSQKHHSITWPLDVLYNKKHRKHFQGFTMPLVDTALFQESHRYYSPSDRMRFFPGFTWQHLFTAAYNMASSIAALHEKGHCVGDLRETNILVAPSSLVTLVDCDSFQVKDARSGRIFYTRVGTGEYLPPELLGVDFTLKDYDRRSSDTFALAILIFKFLMNGVHPYQSRGPLVDDAPSPEAKIKKGHFPYVNAKGVQPPDYALPYDMLPPSLQELFQRCFVQGHGDPGKRPSAVEWYLALREEIPRVQTCAAVKIHIYSSHLPDCPWCKVAADKGEDPSEDGLVLGEQIALSDPIAPREPLKKRIDYLRGMIKVAVADGVFANEEEDYIARIGAKLQIPLTTIKEVIREETEKHQKKAGAKKSFPPASRSFFMFLPAIWLIRTFQNRATAFAATITVLGSLNGALLGYFYDKYLFRGHNLDAFGYWMFTFIVLQASLGWIAYEMKKTNEGRLIVSSAFFSLAFGTGSYTRFIILSFAVLFGSIFLVCADYLYRTTASRRGPGDVPWIVFWLFLMLVLLYMVKLATY